MRTTITEIHEVEEFEGQRGTMYSFFVAFEDGSLAKINAMSSSRYKAGQTIEFEADLTKKTWSREGGEYQPGKVILPERGGKPFGNGSRRPTNGSGRTISNGTTQGATQPRTEAPRASGDEMPSVPLAEAEAVWDLCFSRSVKNQMAEHSFEFALARTEALFNGFLKSLRVEIKLAGKADKDPLPF